MVYIGIETDMAQPPSTSTVLKFDAYALDLRAGELFKNGKKIKIQEQPVQILAMLLERPGEVVTREELRERLWSEDTFVDFEHSLNTAIKKLRLALNDDPEKPRFIETLRRRGYRFATAVVESADEAARREPAAPAAKPPSKMAAKAASLWSRGRSGSDQRWGRARKCWKPCCATASPPRTRSASQVAISGRRSESGCRSRAGITSNVTRSTP